MANVVPPMKVAVLHYQPSSEPEDPVVGHVVAALKELGHTPVTVGVHDRVGEVLKSIQKAAADLVFNDCDELTRRVRDIRKELGDEALAEEFIDGREVYVGVIGTPNKPEILPVVELDWGNWKDGEPKVSDREVKFGAMTADSPHLVMAQNISPELKSRIERAALLAFRALKISDYARVDFRISSPGNEPYVLEVNPNPYPEKD